MTKKVDVVQCNYCKFEEVLFNVETDGGFLLSPLAFSLDFQSNDLFFHAEVGFLLFFLLKGFPEIPNWERRMRSRVGRCKVESPPKLTDRYYFFI